jgi:rhodanese-related sulfurtransferase
MIRIIGHSEIARKIQACEHLYIVDTGSFEQYLKVHLPRALFLPHDDVDHRVPQILPDKGAEIIIYDGSPSKDAILVARRLRELGYFNLFIYPGGRADWIAQGNNTEVFVTTSYAQQFDPTTSLGYVLDYSFDVAS